MSETDFRARAKLNPKGHRFEDMTEGRVFEASMNVGIPLQDLDVQWQKLTQKFHALVDPLLGRDAADTLVDLCRNLEAVSDLKPFWRLIRGTA